MRAIGLWLWSWVHLAEKGHRANWYDMGADGAECVECLHGGKGVRIPVGVH